MTGTYETELLTYSSSGSGTEHIVDAVVGRASHEPAAGRCACQLPTHGVKLSL